MSTIMNYRRLTPHQLAQLQAELQADPEIVSKFLYGDEEDEEDEEEGEDYLKAAELDIDKSWHAIHFMLTGDPWGGEPPLANVVLGGTVLGDEDVGYGPARFLTSDEVREIAEALNTTPSAELRRRFVPKELMAADIYPQIWDEGEDALRYVVEYYEMLTRFFNEANEADEAMLLYMN